MGIAAPGFLKDMGHEFLAYILNINEEEAKGILNGCHETDPIRQMVLDGLIKHCSRIRHEAIDTNAIAINLALNLQSWVYNNKHQFNIWREQLGGNKHPITTKDPLLKVLSQIALEAYPLLLIKTSRPLHFIELNMSGLINNLSDSHLLLVELKNDSSIQKLFYKTSDHAPLKYRRTSARSHSNYGLEWAPSLLLRNIFILYKLRGSSSIESLLKIVEDAITTLRNIADEKETVSPLLVGFQNLGTQDAAKINTPIGKIIPYKDFSFYSLSEENRPSTQDSGIILESSFTISDSTVPTPPKKPQNAAVKIEELNENLSLAIALATNRTPPTGIKLSWSYYFDPLDEQIDFITHLTPKSSMPNYKLTKEDEIEINYWLGKITQTQNSNIRIAIQRFILSINERDNPVDGFIDAIIALENLLGTGQGELNYRISIAAAKLLETDLDKRKALQKKVNDLYTARSKIVHGATQLPPEEAEKKWYDSLDLVLRIFRALYSNHPELLAEKDRSKILALL